MVTATITGVEAVTERFQKLPEDIKLKLAKKMPEIGQYLANHVTRDKLSGQVLHVRSGNLRRSIEQRTTVGANDVTTIVGVTQGPALDYARIHEYGATVSRTSSRGKAYQAIYPERSYLRSGLADLDSQIRAQMREAVR